MFTPPPRKEITRKDAERAAFVLGIPEIDGLTVTAVRAAFRDRARQVHPDAGGAALLQGTSPGETLAGLQVARDVLAEWVQMVPDAECPTCRGRGVVPTGNRFSPHTKCPTCQG